jgi:diguanylate cyclase (GGDEF)-like protein/PAS domain S-box-containing protein
VDDVSAPATGSPPDISQRTVLSSLPETMVLLCDRDLRCSLLDGALAPTLGLPPSAGHGQWLTDLLPPDCVDQLTAPLRDALAGSPGSVELRWVDGDRRLEVDLAPFRPDGEVTGVLTVWRDVTTRLARERESAFLAEIVNQSRDAIIFKNARGIITEWNLGAEALYGYTAAEAVGAPIAMLVPPERAGEDRELLARALAGQPVRQYRTTRVRRDRTRVEVSISLSPIHDPDGRVTGASVIARDITERVHEEQARQAAEEQLRITVEHAPIGVGLLELDPERRGRLVSANMAMATLLGVSVTAAADLTLGSVVHPDDGARLDNALKLLADSEISRDELEVRMTDADGHVAWVLLALAAVPGAPGPRRDHAVIHAMNIGERKRFEGRLQHLADHDSLTGLFNRQRFERELDRAVADSNRYGTPCVLLMIDLDGFKYVNDTLGHPAGDELVAKVGRLLRDSLRETDVVARIGGDEFAAIVTHTNQATGLVVCRKLLTALQDQAVMLSDRRQARVTASVGLTSFDGTPSVSAEELLVEADIAVYQAKEAGKNRVAVYSREDGERSRIVGRENWLARIRSAIETDGFELFVQPIRGIRAHDVEHFELLLRMHGEDGALILPSHFLASAERFDLVQGIDRWVFGQALGLLRRHHRDGHDIALSVNMSGKTLGDPDILGDLAAMIADCPVPTGRLIVEVTETAAITTIDRAREVAVGLRELGCRFALDDFGAGFASFYYLKHLEFDYLKIDGEFVKNLTQSATDQLVVKAVVDIARGLGARTIAECVNDAAAVRCLDALGVDFGQGYYLGEPAPLELALPAA